MNYSRVSKPENRHWKYHRSYSDFTNLMMCLYMYSFPMSFEIYPPPKYVHNVFLICLKLAFSIFYYLKNFKCIFTIAGYVQGLFLDLYSRVTPSEFRGHYRVLEIEAGLAACKTNALLSVLSLWPNTYFESRAEVI